MYKRENLPSKFPRWAGSELDTEEVGDWCCHRITDDTNEAEHQNDHDAGKDTAENLGNGVVNLNPTELHLPKQGQDQQQSPHHETSNHPCVHGKNLLKVNDQMLFQALL